MSSVLRVNSHPLPGGTTLYTQGTIGSARISVLSWISRAGSALDPPGKEGLAALTARLLTIGTRRWSKRELARRLDRLAATLSVDTGWDGLTVEITGPAAVEKELMAILAAVVAHPRFDPAEVTRIRTAMEERVVREHSQPAQRVERAFLETLFPAGHPYHRSPGGTRRSIRSLSEKDVREFHRRFYRSRGSKIAITSRSTEATLRAEIGAHLPPLPEGSPLPAPEVPTLRQPSKRVLALPIAGSQQVEVLLGGLAPTRSHPTYSALRLGNEVLGGRPILARLFQSVREAEGLAYDTESDVSMLPEGGFWTAEAGTGAPTVKKVIDLMQKEVRRIARAPVPAAELKGIRESFIGSFLLHTDTPAAAHSFADEIATFDLPPDYFEVWPAHLRRITPTEIRDAMAAQLQGWDDPLLVVAGPPQGVRAITRR